MVVSATDQCRHLHVVGNSGAVGDRRRRRHGSNGAHQCVHGHHATQATGKDILEVFIVGHQTNVI